MLVLPEAIGDRTSQGMKLHSRWARLRANPGVRLGLFILGILLLIASPFAGAIPGPGGVFVFAGGLALVLQNSAWAKRRYVAFKRRWPKAGSWSDWGLRRASARRRDEIAKSAATPPVD